ncbi:MAG: VWA domain-containing protein, partial [Chloroflexota bacterium]|nr:VWA domain-containing protein [Chloroflexota bacterium]
MSKKTNFYQRLGISEGATPDEIKRAYHRAAHRTHPDVNVKPGATELFLDIKEAYEVLIDPEGRTNYNRKNQQKKRAAHPVRINTQYSRSAIQYSHEQQVIYAIVDMDILPDPEHDQDPATAINIALVLDTSTSMKGARLNTVKATAIELVRQLRKQDSISIITFNDRANVVIEAGTHANINKAEMQIRSLHPDGGTEIFKGLDAGFEEVQRYYHPSHSNHIILITDGHTYGDEAACKSLADKAAKTGIGLSSLGIGGKWNDELLDDLATRTGGNCLYIRKPKNIRPFLSQKLRNLSQAYAKNIRFSFQTGQEITLRYAFRLEPDIGMLHTKSPLQLGSIARDQRHRILFEFIVDPIPTEIKQVLLIDGEFGFDIPSKSYSSFRIPITMTLSTQAESLSEN